MFFTLLGKDSSNSDPIFGIEVTVAERVDPSTLPLEDRIPDCLDDVPVRIKVEPSVSEHKSLHLNKRKQENQK